MTRLLLAIAILLAVPVAQLRTIDVEMSCCCPDPARCHCADHDRPSGPTSVRACHSSSTVFVGSQLAAFTPPEPIVVSAPVVRIAVIETRLPAPHAPPTAARPAAPS